MVKARKQLRNVRSRLKDARLGLQRSTRRNRQLAGELEASRTRPSFARRVVRKVRGGTR